MVCFDRESRNFEAVLWLRELLESECLERGGGPPVPIYAHLPTELGFQQVLSGSAEFRDSEAVTLVSYGGHGQSDPYRIARPVDALAWRARPARPGEPAAALTVPANAVEQLARMEHHRWMAERLIAGWRYGETRVSAASPWHENRRGLSLVCTGLERVPRSSRARFRAPCGKFPAG